jgi:hypothetical protein
MLRLFCIPYKKYSRNSKGVGKMYRRILLFITLIAAMLLCSCSPLSIDKIETREIEATIKEVYVLHSPHTYVSVLEYGGEITCIDSELLYNYCEDHEGETIPAILEITYYYNNSISYKILPHLEILR